MGFYFILTFSILSRIVGVETSIRRGRAGVPQSFSILSRIVGVETGWGAGGRCPHLYFQYPQSDRWG